MIAASGLYLIASPSVVLAGEGTVAADVAKCAGISTSTASLGEKGQKVKVYAFIIKKPGLTDEQFHAHWRDPHGTLTATLPYFKRYVQNHGIGSLPTLPGLTPMPYLGIPTVWVDQLSDLEAAVADPLYAPLDRDVDELYIRDKAAWLFTTEYSRCVSPTNKAFAPIKAQVFIKQKPGTSDFEGHMAEFSKALGSLPGVIGLTAALPLQGSDAPLFDGVVEVSFEDQDHFEAAWTDDGPDGALAMLDTFADRDGSRGFLSREERVIWP
ncbi:EthD family reductase [Croceicoccus ponticola]|uniref:EthD domain-containing protein n=1 Tax=Croceicoccus ponticola TaxID=2217664 RepID=UPI0013E3100A|nr:EthD family reductase [Croceicoccus ponticola]